LHVQQNNKITVAAVVVMDVELFTAAKNVVLRNLAVDSCCTRRATEQRAAVRAVVTVDAYAAATRA
jgi:hypothetical protein